MRIMFEAENGELKRVHKDIDCIYRKWNEITALCYSRKMVCKGCNNAWACAQTDNKGTGNKYKIRMIKYAVLKTYANIGTKGLEKYL